MVRDFISRCKDCGQLLNHKEGIMAESVELLISVEHTLTRT